MIIRRKPFSPSRIYINNFLKEKLKTLIPAEEINVLDVGCGSGYIREIFKDLDYRINYTGLDIEKHKNFDNFNRFAQSEFVNSRIEDYQTNKKFDLIISMAALEHIKDNEKALTKIKEILSPNGIQIHFVPSKWSYPLYFKHGYRRYSTSNLHKLFGNDIVLHKMGGLFSFLLHFFFITIPRKVFKSNHLFDSTIYLKLIKISNKLDKIIPLFPTFYIVLNPIKHKGWPRLGLGERVWYRLNQTFLYYYLKTVSNSKKKHFVFYHLTRSGGTSIKYWLRKQGYSNRILGLVHYYNVRNIKFKNKNIVEFAIIRNPFSWYVSLYNSKVATTHKKKKDYYPKMEKNSFDDFFNDLVLFKNGKEGIKRWHYPWLEKSAPYEMAQKYNPEYGWCTNNLIHYLYPRQESVKILKVEKLQEEIDNLFKDTDIKLNLKKKIKNVESKENYMDYYTPEMIEEVKKRDKIVFDLYE